MYLDNFINQNKRVLRVNETLASQETQVDSATLGFTEDLTGKKA